MKRYLTYIVFAALALLALGCKKEDDADRKELDSRQRVPISVTCSVDGTQVTALSFAHGAMQKTIDVAVNNENLHWNLESNRPWCKVVQAEHVGSGSVTLEIEANEGFEARDPATLFFKAGDYSSASLTVNQNGSAFIISHPYLLSSKEEETFEVAVKTVEGTVWAVESGAEWIETETGDVGTEDGMTVTTLRLKPMANDGDSRYGTVTLSTGDDSDSIAIYQFGDDLQYDGEGNIFFSSDEPASISFTAPTYVVKEVVFPAYATVSNTDAGSGRVTWTVAFEDNFSDCELIREIPVSIILNNAVLTSIELPSMRQDFTSAGGLMTAVGIKTFAAKVAEGGDISSWQTDGVVRVLQDIDMDGVDDWTGIGTEEHPFSGVFDGEGHSIVNLRNSNFPLFNVCNEATVKNLTIAKSCSFYFEDDETVAPLAIEAKATKFERCDFSGDLEYGGTPDESIVGGLVGHADGTSVINLCKMTGSISLNSGTKADAKCFTGGIAGLCEGSLTNSEFVGTINCMSGIPNDEIGGITSTLDEGADVSGNSFTGEIEINGNSKALAVGGLYGHIRTGGWSFDHASDLSLTGGSIKIVKFAASKDVSRVFVGGFVGLIAGNVGLKAKGYTTLTNFTLDMKTNAPAGSYLNCGGFLGSCEPDATAGEMLFDNIENRGVIDIQFSTTVYNQVRRMCIGGVVGLVRGKATFNSCVNKAEIGKNEVTSCGSLDSSNNRPGNGMTEIIGGIAGHAYGGHMVFSQCTNEGKLCNGHYNNNASNGKYGNFLTPPCTGGILGAFNFKPTPENISVVFDTCGSTGDVWAFRGFVGGTVGFAQKATISGCGWNNGNFISKNTGQASFQGGIAGGLASATVSGCKVANVNLLPHKGGSAEAADAGGIVGRVIAGDKVEISNCSFHGELTTSAPTGANNFAGGIVSTVQGNTEISNCSFGGKVLEASVSESNVYSKAVGNGTPAVLEEITLWNGI